MLIESLIGAAIKYVNELNIKDQELKEDCRQEYIEAGLRNEQKAKTNKIPYCLKCGENAVKSYLIKHNRYKDMFKTNQDDKIN